MNPKKTKKMADTITTGCGDCFAPIIMDNVASMRRDIAKTEADIKEALAAQTQFQAGQFCDIGKSVQSEGALTRLSLTNAERDLQNRIAETRLEALNTAKQVNDRITAFERNADMQFRDVFINIEKNTQKIIDKVAHNMETSLRDELEKERIGRLRDGFGSNFALADQRISNLSNMINSIDQTQKFGSKVTQFGAGNVATPVQTANQG